MRSAFYLSVVLGVVSLGAACGSSPANSNNANKPPATPANVAVTAITPVSVAPANAATNAGQAAPNSKTPASKVNAANKIDRMAVADDDAPPANAAKKKK